MPAGAQRNRLLTHDFLTERGMRDSPDLVSSCRSRADPALAGRLRGPAPAFAERDIAWHPRRLVHGLDPRKVAVFGDGTEMPYDLFLGVPVHKVPEVVESRE